MIRLTFFVWILAALPVGLIHADPGDSAAEDVSPTPSPAHHHKHVHPTPSDSGDETTASTPEAKTHNHHHPADSDEPSGLGGSGGSGDLSGLSDEMLFVTPAPAADPPDSQSSETPRPRPSVAPDASLDSGQLEEFSQQPPEIQSLIESALALTRQNLTYTYGSDDPANGGVDCSGFIYYVLTQAGLKDAPRDASDQYSWVRKAGNFRAVISRRLDGFETDELKPGDLLFWRGTYETDRDPPVTHVMIYLGREKETGNRVMAGSSDGRSYHGLQRWGASVFDFKPVPATEVPGRTASQFIGYGAIPGY